MVEKTFFSETVKIEAPRNFVFNFLTDFSEKAKWVEGLKVEDVSPNEGNKIGTHIRETVAVHGHTWEYKGEITDYKKDEYLKMDIGDEKENIKLDYTLTDGDYDGTLLTETATIIEGSLIHRWLTGFEKRTLQKRLLKFKEVVEDEYKKGS